MASAASMDYYCRTVLVFVIVLVALLGLALGQDAPTPPADLKFSPTGELKQGDNLTITCTVYKPAQFDFVEIIRQIRGRDHGISDNGILKEDVRNTGRYSIQYSEDRQTKVATVTITITNVQGEDSGNIGCKNAAKKLSAFEDLVIFVPPKSVNMYYKNVDGEEVPVENGQAEILLQEGKPSSLRCEVVVEGTDIEPKVSLMMDKDDVTTKFQETVQKPEVEENFFDQFEKQSATSQYVLSEDSANRDYDGSTFRCTAEMDHFPPISKEIKIKVNYSPDLVCSKQMPLYTKVGTTDVRIMCRGTMQPGPVFFEWSFGKKGNKTILQKDETSEDGRFTAAQEHLGESEYEFYLQVSEVEEADFIRYKLSVSNGIGDNAKGVVKLNKDVPTTTTTTTTITPAKSDLKEEEPAYKHAVSGHNSASSLMASSFISMATLALLLRNLM